jgi:CDP-6-deoxy-D-xylo-4-hexulose-3-dehydrase
MKNLKYKSKKDSAIVSNEVMRNGILLGCHHGMNIKELEYIKNIFIKFLKIKNISL